MDLEGDIDARLIEGVEDRPPAPSELVEGGLDQSGRALRPGIEVRPRERPGEGGVRGKAEIGRGLRRELQLLNGPRLALARIAAHRLGREAVEGEIVGGMDRDQLALQVRRELGRRNLVARQRAVYLVTIGLAVGGAAEIKQAAV